MVFEYSERVVMMIEMGLYAMELWYHAGQRSAVMMLDAVRIKVTQSPHERAQGEKWSRWFGSLYWDCHLLRNEGELWRLKTPFIKHGRMPCYYLQSYNWMDIKGST